MKWTTHQLSAIAITAILGLPMPIIAGSVFGAIFPDQLDFMYSKGICASKRTQQARWNKVHRGLSHFWGLYLLLLPICLFFSQWATLSFLDFVHRFFPTLARNMSVETLPEFMFGFIIGAFSHILTDMLNPSGVPLYPAQNPKTRWKEHRFSINLVSTGSSKETVFSLVIMLVLVGALLWQNQDNTIVQMMIYKIIKLY